MRDIYLAMAVIGLVSLVVLALACATARRVSRRTATLICGLVVALIVIHVLAVSDRLWVTRIVPLSSVPILGNPLPIAVAALAGFAWRVIPGGVVRRGALLLILASLCAHRSLAPVFAARPEPLGDRWVKGVCLQTSPATCSPAAAATLLRAAGINASESEMARLCLTTDAGTTNHGLYRGLRLKTAGTGWDVETFRTDAAGLQTLNGPALLVVRLNPGANVDPRYEKLWGWTPGVSHTVVFFGFTDHGAKVEMGDPDVGREQWFARDLSVLWHGEALRLVRRR